MAEPKPDVERLMAEVREAAARIPDVPPQSPLFDVLEESWDVWAPPAIESHRKLLGRPVVWAKKLALWALRPVHQELLRRQRAYNAAVKDELAELRRKLDALAAALPRDGGDRQA